MDIIDGILTGDGVVTGHRQEIWSIEMLYWGDLNSHNFTITSITFNLYFMAHFHYR